MKLWRQRVPVGRVQRQANLVQIRVHNHLPTRNEI